MTTSENPMTNLLWDIAWGGIDMAIKIWIVLAIPLLIYVIIVLLKKKK